MKRTQLTFSDTEIDQLLAYCNCRAREGWYYGNRKYFEKRHDRIVHELFDGLKRTTVSASVERGET